MQAKKFDAYRENEISPKTQKGLQQHLYKTISLAFWI